MKTSLCRLLNIEHPIVQAPLGSASCPALAAAVSNAGGLGMLALSWQEAEEIRSAVRETRKLTKKSFGVNLVLEWQQFDRLRICLEEGVRIFSFFWGNPAQYVEKVHQVGALAIHTVGSVEEARRAAECGADAIVAQGWEAGGHVRGEVGTMALIPGVVDALSSVPVVASGGIGDGRGLAAALALGATGIWVGTRFLASEESLAHPLYKQKLLDATENETMYSTLFDIGWENAPHRTLLNSTVIEGTAAEKTHADPRKIKGEEVIAATADGRPIVRYSDTIPLSGMSGDVEALALYAGQSTGLVSRILPAGEIVRLMANEAREIIQKNSLLLK